MNNKILIFHGPILTHDAPLIETGFGTRISIPLPFGTVCGASAPEIFDKGT
jgi:hypothetical protein